MHFFYSFLDFNVTLFIAFWFKNAYFDPFNINFNLKKIFCNQLDIMEIFYLDNEDFGAKFGFMVMTNRTHIIQI